jgi:hypothetical protein
MAQAQPVPVSTGDLIYDVNLQITAVMDFGITLEEMLGDNTLPPAGARLDVSWEGTATGPVTGHVKGTDYLYVRPDRRFEVHIHGTISTDDEARLSFSAAGVATPLEDGTIRLYEYLTAHTCFEQYSWLNHLVLRGEGVVNLATGSISLQVYAA